ncbi:Nucleic acid-binding, OB-fold [Sesbania bispinosa]|nr:Nucleic acid-binding, OB-fold [Sesbania bispinosa]
MQHVLNRYSVKVEVSDGKDLTHLQIGDEDIERLVNVSCRELISRMEKPHSTTYPEIFNCLIGKRMLFVVETKSFFDVHEGCFKVLRTCADKELPMSTIAGLLGERRIAPPCNHDKGSSYANAIPETHFTHKDLKRLTLPQLLVLLLII